MVPLVSVALDSSRDFSTKSVTCVHRQASSPGPDFSDRGLIGEEKKEWERERRAEREKGKGVKKEKGVKEREKDKRERKGERETREKRRPKERGKSRPRICLHSSGYHPSSNAARILHTSSWRLSKQPLFWDREEEVTTSMRLSLRVTGAAGGNRVGRVSVVRLA